MTRVIKIKLKAPSFTPGPWSAEPTHGGTWGATIRIWGGKVRSGIADVCVRRNINATGEPSAEEIANARLMAAAPDLFEALKELEAEATRLGNHLSSKGQGATVLGMKCRAAQLALAKAEGRD